MSTQTAGQAPRTTPDDSSSAGQPGPQPGPAGGPPGARAGSARRRAALIALATRAVVVVLLLILAVGVYMRLVATAPQPAAAPPAGELPRILVMPAAAAPVAPQWEGFGTAAARHAVNVPAQVRGMVIEVPGTIVAGAPVEQGQLLARLDEADFEHEAAIARSRIDEIDARLAQIDVEMRSALDRLELAQDELAIAEAELQRVLEAREVGGATQREVDQSRAAVMSARRSEVTIREQVQGIEPRQAQLRAMRDQQQQALQLAERNLARTRIESPITGVIQALDIEQGEAVHADQRIARIVRLDRIEVPLRLPAGAHDELVVGGEAVLQSVGSVDREWRGRIARIAPEVDQATRTTTVYVEIEQTSETGGSGRETLAPGRFLRGMVGAGAARERWLVPRRAIRSDRIWFIEDGIVRSERISVDFHVRLERPETGLADRDWAVLRQPLREGALVIVDAARTLAEGMRAEPVIAGGPQTAAEGRGAEQPRSSAVSSEGPKK